MAKAATLNVPQSGSPEASAFADAVERRVAAVEKRFADDFVSMEEIGQFCMTTGLNSVTDLIAKENGSDLVFTALPKPVKAKKPRRARMAI